MLLTLRDLDPGVHVLQPAGDSKEACRRDSVDVQLRARQY